MDAERLSPAEKVWTAEELRRLPPERRNAILASAAELVEELYRKPSGLTDFEAFGPDDLHGECSAAQEG